MNKLVFAALVISTTSGCFNGCQKKKEAEAIEPMPTISAQPEGSSATAPQKTGEQLAQAVIASWAAFNDSKWDDYKALYTPDAQADDPAGVAAGLPNSAVKGFPAIVDDQKQFKLAAPDANGDVRLVLVNDRRVAALVATTGTHTGPVPGVTEMNQKIAVIIANVDAMTDQGLIAQQTSYEDLATSAQQLVPDPKHPVRTTNPDVPKEIVVAKNDDAEKANVAVVQSLVDAFNKHDATAMGSAFADDVVWSEQENPKDWTKAEVLADAQSTWKAFSDMKITSTALWSAGTYVVLQATNEGTNDGAAPAMGIATPTKKKVTLPFLEIDQIANGKIAKAWIVANSMVVPVELRLGIATKLLTGSAAK